MSLNYVKGDATRPIGTGPKFIIHVCNDKGYWGAGFVLAVSKRWHQPEARYREVRELMWGEDMVLGRVQIVKVEENLWVVNMIGQHNVGFDRQGCPPIRYSAIYQALTRVAEVAKEDKYCGEDYAVSIHAPKFGAGLAGGDWDRIEGIIDKCLIDAGLDVTIYEFDG